MEKENKGACTDRGGHCCYKISINGKMLICDKCSRVKAVRESGETKWEFLA